MSQKLEELQSIIEEQRQEINSLKIDKMSVVSHALVGICYVDSNGVFIEVNKKFCEIVGYTKNELLKLSFKDITHQSDLEKDLEIHNKSKDDGTNNFSLEKRYVKKNGSIISCEIFVNHIKDKNNNFIYTIGFVTDITKRKKIEDTILEEAKSMQRYLDIVDVMIFAMNRQGNITHVNRKTCEVLGYKEHSILGRNWFKNFLPDDCKEDLIENYIKLINKEVKNIEKTQHQVLCKNGEERTISWSRAYVYDDKQNITGLILSGEDVTNLIKLEKENKRTEQILFNQSKMASMGEMLRNIAHQWRQPLSTISTAASGIKIQKELGLLEESEFYSSMDAIVDTTQYLSQTIDDFQNFFKIDNALKKFTCDELLKSVSNLIKTSYKANQIEFEISSSKNYLISGYFNETIQVIINILNNAKDAFIDSNLDNRVVFINSSIKDDTLEFVIKDNAGGIPENIFDNIFEPYFTTKHQSLGTGIGLYMTKDIVENRLNGTIEVKNEDIYYNNTTRKGAVFKLVISTSFE